MAALATMLRRALLPLGSQRILHIAAISRHQKLTPHFSRIQPLSTAGEPSAHENLIRAVEAPEVPVGFPFEIEDEPGVDEVYLHRTYGDKVVQIGVDTGYVIIDDEGNTLESFPAVASVTRPNGQLLMFDLQVSRGKFEIDYAEISYSKPLKEVFSVGPAGFCVRDFGPSMFEAYCKYLEGREMDASASMSFLYNYIDYRNKRDYIVKNSVLNSRPVGNLSRWQADERSARKISLARKKLASDSP